MLRLKSFSVRITRPRRQLHKIGWLYQTDFEREPRVVLHAARLVRRRALFRNGIALRKNGDEASLMGGVRALLIIRNGVTVIVQHFQVHHGCQHTPLLLG